MCLKSCFSGNTSEPSVLANGATRGEFWLAVHDFPAVLPTAYRDQDLERELGIAVSGRYPGASVTPHTLIDILSLVWTGVLFNMCASYREPVSIPSHSPKQKIPAPETFRDTWTQTLCFTEKETGLRCGAVYHRPRPYCWCQRWE